MNYEISAENCELQSSLRGKMENELQSALLQEPLISSINLCIKQTVDKKFNVNMDAHCWHKDFHYTKTGADLYATMLESQKRLLLEIRANKKKNFKLRKKIA